MTTLTDAAHLVKTVGELDLMVNQALVKMGAAKKPKPGESVYRITDKQAAQSSNIMPRVLNPLGKKGWNLAAINKMECYIFLRGEPVEYKVMTPADIDRMSVALLQERGVLQLSGFEGDAPTLEMVDPAGAKIQTVLPEIFDQLSQDRWSLCAINGPQLYFFCRPLQG